MFYFILFGLPVLFLTLSFPNFQIQIIPIKNYVKIYYYKLSYNLDIQFLILILIALTYIFWGTFVQIKKLKKLKTIKEKNQTKFFLLGFLTIFGLFILNNAFRSFLGQIVSFYFLSTLISFIISIFFLFVVLRYKIFSLTQTIKSGIGFSIFSNVILIIYLAIILVLSKTIAYAFKINSDLFVGTIIIIFFLLIKPVEEKVQKLIDRFFHRNIIAYRKNFIKLTKELKGYLTTENFILENVIILLYDSNNEKFVKFPSKPPLIEINMNTQFIKDIIKIGNVTELYELNFRNDEKEILNNLNKFNIKLILPLIYKNNLLSIILLSNKKYRKDFNQDDVEALSIVNNEIALAFQRNKMIEEIQKKAKEKYHLEKLAALGQLTAGIAHEIRNPLNTISMSAQTLVKKGLQENQQKELIHYITDEVDRLERILKDFLKLSKYRSAKIDSVNIEKLINTVILNIEMKNDNNITVNKTINLKSKIIKTDQDMLFQVLLNLGLNSYDAIIERCKNNKDFNCQNGEIHFSVIKKDKNIILKISDNGNGIDKKRKDSVFNPFYTTKLEGTGLGLSITHSLIENLKGKIEFNSKFGRTEFKINLPE